MHNQVSGLIVATKFLTVQWRLKQQKKSKMAIVRTTQPNRGETRIKNKYEKRYNQIQIRQSRHLFRGGSNWGSL